MEHRLAIRKDTPVIGYVMEATPFSPEIPKMWERVHGNGDFDRLMKKSRQMENFGLCIMSPGMPEGTFKYMIAFDHDEDQPLDDDMETYIVSGGEYAVFRAPSMEGIAQMFKKIYDEWLPTSQYKYDAARPADFEYYTMQGDEVVCDIYVPVAAC